MLEPPTRASTETSAASAPRAGGHAREPTTLLELLESRAALTPDGAAYAGSGLQPPVSWRELAEAIRAGARMLSALGIEAGARVAIVMPTSLAWECAHFSVVGAGAVVVGLDPRSDPRSLAECIAQASVTSMLVDGMERLAMLDESTRRRIRIVACVPADPLDIASWRTYTRRADGGLAPVAAPRGDELPRLPSSEGLATIVFTSGSMGRQKALGFTHAQLMLAVRAIVRAFPGIGPGHALVAWLPLSALFQRMIDLAAVYVGATTRFAESPAGVIACARATSPELFVGVPRFFQELRRAMLARAGWRRRWALALTLRAARARGAAMRTGRSAILATVALGVLRFVAAPLRSVLGSSLRAIVVGSSPMPLTLIDELEGLGLPVLEAYGLSECVLPIAMNRLADRRAGSVGRVLEENLVRLAPDGEIEVKSEGLAAGIGSPLDLTHDGFFRTGDLGTIEPSGHLRLLGRKEGLLKLSDGRKLDPAPIEEAITGLSWVDQAQVVGHGLPRAGAIVWVRSESAGSDPVALRADLRRVARTLPERLRPTRYLVIGRPASIDAREVTTTMKLRRAANAARHAPHFASAWLDDAPLDGTEEVTWLPLTS